MLNPNSMCQSKNYDATCVPQEKREDKNCDPRWCAKNKTLHHFGAETLFFKLGLACQRLAMGRE
jgi:hypothetical protein